MVAPGIKCIPIWYHLGCTERGTGINRGFPPSTNAHMRPALMLTSQGVYVGMNISCS